MNFSEMSLEELRKIYDDCQAEATWYQNKLDEIEREIREEWEQATRQYGEERAMYVLGFGPCTGMTGLCNVIIDDCKKAMAEIEAEVKRRGMGDEFKK